MKTKAAKKTKKFMLLSKACMIRELAFAKAFAIMLGLYMLCLGLVATYIGLGAGLVSAIGSAYIGFVPSLEGSLIGAVWGAIVGFLMGYVSAWLYNKL
jgi:hypothetical protein